MFRYTLEVPIDPKDAKRRGLRKDISKLVVQVDDRGAERESTLLKLGESIFAIRRNDEVIHAVPISSFPPVETYEKFLKEKKIPYWYDNEFKDKEKPEALLVECDSEEKCSDVLRYIDSEAILFYSIKAMDKGSESKLMKASSDGYSEKLYLKELEKYGFFVFFAKSHMSLEVLGFEGPVLNCLALVRPVLRQSKVGRDESGT